MRALNSAVKLCAMGVLTALGPSCGDYYGSTEAAGFQPTVSGNTPQNQPKVVIGVNTESCPVLEYTLVAPTVVPIGGSAKLDSRATEPARNPISYFWTSTGGTISDASVASSTLTCTQAGIVEVFVTVSNGACVTASQRISVTCE